MQQNNNNISNNNNFENINQIDFKNNISQVIEKLTSFHCELSLDKANRNLKLLKLFNLSKNL